MEAMVHAPVPDRLHLATEWPRANEGGVAAIREWIDAHPCVSACKFDPVRLGIGVQN